MVLVDSSVWIDYLSLRASLIDQQLEALIKPVNQVVVTGIIFQEVLQGIKNQRSYQLVHRLMGRLPFLVPTPGTHLKAAEIFRRLSALGARSSTVDALIAALAIENKIPLFTRDTGFRSVQKHTQLKLFA